MKPNVLITGVAIAVVTLGLVSWQVKHGGHEIAAVKAIHDTIPAREKKIRNLDEAIEELDPKKMDDLIRLSLEQAKLGLQQIDQQKLQEELSKIDMKKLKLETDKAMREAQLAMKNVNINKALADAQAELKKINWDDMKVQQDLAIKQAELALKNVDLDKALADARVEMKKINWDDMKVQQELAIKQAELALKSVDMDKVMREANESMEKINWDRIQAEVDETKNLKIQEKLKDMQPELERAMANAKKDMEKARAEMMEYKKLVDGLHEDGLINKDKSYSIRIKDGELFINDKKASKNVTDKYEWFLKKHSGLTIQKTDDNFSINNNKERI